MQVQYQFILEDKLSLNLVVVERTIAKVFYSMFELEKTYSEVRLGKDFEQKVLKWLDNNQEYLEQAHRQV